MGKNVEQPRALESDFGYQREAQENDFRKRHLGCWWLARKSTVEKVDIKKLAIHDNSLVFLFSAIAP